MEGCKWRLRAWTVGMLDLSLTVLGVIGFVYSIAQNYENLFYNGMAPFSIIYISFVILIALIQVWAADTLILGTEKGMNPEEALRFCGRWRQATFALWTLAAIRAALGRNWMILALIFVIRGTFVFVVTNYMNELKTCMSSPFIPSDDPVRIAQNESTADALLLNGNSANTVVTIN